MSYIVPFLKIFIMVSFLMFIIRGIVKDCHVSKKGLVYFLVSLCLLIVGVVAFFVDRAMALQLNDNPLLYVYFIASTIIYLVYGIVLMCKGKKLPKKIKKEMIYTYHKKDEYVCILFKHNSLIYLTKDTNFPLKFKIGKTDFADDVVNGLIERMNIKLTFEGVNRIGVVTHKGDKVDDVYYCYLVEVEDVINDNKLQWVNSYEVTRLEVPDLERFIILKTLMREEFDEVF